MILINSSINANDDVIIRDDEVIYSDIDNDKPPYGINISKYYISNWSSNKVILDISSDRSEIDNMILDLDKITINCDGPMSSISGVELARKIPNLIVVFKSYLNICIDTFSGSSKIRSDVMMNFNNILRFISWMIRIKGVYQFSDLSREDFLDFADSFANQGGWSGILGYPTLLKIVLDDLQAGRIDPSCIVTIESDGRRRISINEKSLQSHLGIPIPMTDVPVWFYNQLSSMMEFQHRSSRKVDAPRSVSRMNLYNVFKSLNRLSGLPEELAPVVFPIPDACKYADKLASKKFQGRTQNLSLDTAIDLFSTAIKWIYEFSPDILDVMAVIRSRLEDFSVHSSRHASSLLSADKDVNFALMKLGKFSGAPFNHVVLDVHSPGYDPIKSPALIEIVENLMTACFIMIAMNHGRRLNEIVGSGSLPYGLYFGCIKPSQGHLNTHFIDIYIEKTVKYWCSFYVNKLVVDAVKVLESINQAFRPLSAPLKTYSSNLGEARKDKLFILRRFTLDGFQSSGFHFNFSKHSKLFSLMADSALDRIDFRAHPFRRFFSLLYYYRYDNPKLIALQHHLRHADPGMTMVYVTDPATREMADRIENLYMNRIDERSKIDMKDMEDVRSEAFRDAIFKLLKGDRTGGNWPKVIVPLYQQLLLNGEFEGMDLQSSAQSISNKLQQSGYNRTAFPHGGCNVGNSYRTKKLSQCFSHEDQEVHLERASPSLCMNCIHFDQGDENLMLLEQSMSSMLEECLDKHMPHVVQKEIIAEAELLEKIIHKERRLAKDNRKTIQSIVGTFAQAIGDELEK